jgi:hypothetical protein
MEDGFRKGAIMKTLKIRHQFLLEPELSRRLGSICHDPRISKSDIIAKAVAAYIDRREESELDQRYAKRLDRISNDLGSVRREVEMILESLALFIRYSVSLTAHMPLPDRAAKALGYKRYSGFVDEVGRIIASGKRPFDEDDKNKSDSMKDGASLPLCSSGKINREEP